MHFERRWFGRQESAAQRCRQATLQENRQIRNASEDHGGIPLEQCSFNPSAVATAMAEQFAVNEAEERVRAVHREYRSGASRFVNRSGNGDFTDAWLPNDDRVVPVFRREGHHSAQTYGHGRFPVQNVRHGTWCCDRDR
jgi:hypothetical protein